MPRISRLGRFAPLILGLVLLVPSHASARQGNAPRKNTTAVEKVDTSEEAEVAETPEESTPVWIAKSSGPIGLVILLMSFYLIAVVAWMFLNYRKRAAIPFALVAEMNDLIERKKFAEAYGRLGQDGSFLARVLAAGVRRLPSGLPAAQRAMEMANDDVTMEMEHRTTYLATVGTLGPMIGLVGTVYGMILSFRVIATAGANPQASQLASGISTALFATLEGIAISVPAIAFYALFRNRIARLSLEVEMTAEGLLEGFAPGVRMPHPLVTQAASGHAGPQRTALPPKEA